MTDHAIATPQRASSVERYRRRETRLWQHYGLAPRERFVDIAPAAGRLRVLEVGIGRAGAVHPRDRRSGIVGVAGRGMPGIRAIVLDRPGWG